MTEAAGKVRDGVHVFPVRVYYEDTDAGGIVYYANYLKFAERARTDLLRILGVEQSRLPIVFVVRRCDADFRKPAHLDDLLQIHSRIMRLKGASIEVEQRVRRGEVDLVTLDVRVACVERDSKGKPTRIPDDLRDSLKEVAMQVSGY